MKNSFRNSNYHEETVVDENNKVVGTIRIKPNAILWKPKGGKKKFYAVPLLKFADWITAKETRALRNEK